jgi:IS30 family transposase
VENMNGLLRQYLPKQTNLNLLTDESLQTIEDLLNNRPRKSLDFATPNEIIKQQLKQLKMVH